MEINASFGKRGSERGVLLMSFHFQPVSFSLEASPCRSPCPLATDVLSEKKSGVVLWIAFCSVASFSSFFLPPSLFHAAFFFFYLEPSCQEKEKNQQRGSIRSNSVYEVFFKAFEEKASEWRRNETKLFPVTFDPASSKSP